MRRESILSFLVAAFTLAGLLLLSGCFGAAKSTSNQTGVAFATPQSFSVGQAPSTVGTADFNDDGAPDLVVANAGSNTVSILLNTTSTPTPSPTASVSASASPTSTPTPSPSASPSPATVSFSNTFDYSVGSGPQSIALADINGDGRIDIVEGNSDGTFGVLINTSSTGTTSPTFSQVYLFTTTGRAQQVTVATGDVNGDGRPDVITSNYTENSISIFLNTTISNTVPQFSGPYTFGTGGGPGQLGVIDINGDGFLDFITANADGSVSVLLGNTVKSSVVPNPSPPTIAQTYTFNVGNGSLYGLVLADFNADGLTDIAVGSGNGNAAVLRNTTNVSSSPSPSPSATVDSSSSNFSVNLSFQQASLFGLNGTPAGLAGGSFAVGGKNDLVAPVTVNNNVSVLVNQSLGTTLTFADGGRWNAGSAPSFVLPVDIDGDGKIDLVVTDRGSNQVSVLINVSTESTSGVATSPTVAATTSTSTTSSTTSTTSTTGTTTGTSTTGSGSSF